MFQFARAEFENLDFTHGLNDPTNPDPSAFSSHGGKLLMWQGYADQGTSFLGTLNYYAAFRSLMGPGAASNFLSLCLLPSVYYCAGGPIAATFDFLTPLIARVEEVPPGKVIVSYRTRGDANSPVTRTRPVFQCPATSVYAGQGNVNDAANYVQGPPTPGVSDVSVMAGAHAVSGQPTALVRRRQRQGAVQASGRESMRKVLCDESGVYRARVVVMT